MYIQTHICIHEQSLMEWIRKYGTDYFTPREHAHMCGLRNQVCAHTYRVFSGVHVRVAVEGRQLLMLCAQLGHVMRGLSIRASAYASDSRIASQSNA